MYHPSLKLSMEMMSLAIEISTLAERCSGAMKRFQKPQSKESVQVASVLPEYDVYSLSDFLKAHVDLMGAGLPDAGAFRTGNGCVFNGKQCIHLAPPASRVAYEMQELFQWLQKSEDHLLIRSCVFHYALDYIRPFTDGNGRMGRLWQSLILREVSPVLSMISEDYLEEDQQKRYYLAFVKAIKAGEAGPFVEYLLQNIHGMLKKLSDSLLDGDASAGSLPLTARQTKILEMLREKSVPAEQIARKLKVSSRTVEREMSKLQQSGAICREGSDKTGCWIVK